MGCEGSLGPHLEFGGLRIGLWVYWLSTIDKSMDRGPLHDCEPCHGPMHQVIFCIFFGSYFRGVIISYPWEHS